MKTQTSKNWKVVQGYKPVLSLKVTIDLQDYLAKLVCKHIAFHKTL